MDNVINKIRTWFSQGFAAFGGAFSRFMTGRNGMDDLGRASVWFYIALCFVRMLFAVFHLKFLTGLSGLILNLFLVIILFRLFSKNLYKRQEENQKWLAASANTREQWRRADAGRYGRRIASFLSGRAARIKNFTLRVKDREHKYFTCENCGAVCRVPKGKGKIVITCPRCGTRIDGKS